MKQLILWCITVCLFFSCSEKKKTGKPEIKEIPASVLTGSELAKMHCGRCHGFVKPELLPKSSWKKDVLPAMGHRLGIFKGNHQPDSLFDRGIGGMLIRKANIFPEQPMMAKSDWKKIVDFYLKNAPDTILPPKREKSIKMGLKHFKYKETAYSHRPPLTAMVRILPNKRGVVYSDGKQDKNSLTFLTPNLELDYNLVFNTTPIHYYEKSDTVYLTTAGKSIFPHDAPEGALQKIYKKEVGQNYNIANTIISNLQRPVFMAYGDLNNDGREDIVACEYGNHTGKLVWFENKGRDKYAVKLLSSKPGAIKAIIKDVNKDGLNDILVLMSQGDEGVFLYENKGNGAFKAKRLLSFLPLYGSQNIELADFNGDGHDDLIYVCGDNADQTPILKKYHGVYIYQNDGQFNFKESFFYPLNGAYKAIPADYDLDGDLDIAVISFFPDYYSYPEESFIYLENKGGVVFDDYSFPEATRGRWIVMDAGDIDEDGDIDLALGSFVYFLAQGDTTGLGKEWLSTGPSVVVLENTTH
ncbi:VCBS repeat-containing protein [Reichenbachiella sp. MALMAid0571]|uniref:FG-GAP repeat domain-containing protein n=1 Tax=Reichenbachiella sp. MALMAid0571 TaxID=3143939 RepID=UPI0032DEB4CD